MTYVTPNKRIDHSREPIPLRFMFLSLEEWLCSKGLTAGPPPGTKSSARVNTTSFSCVVGNGTRVLCSLQYLPQGGWLQFHWYKEVLKECGLLEQFRTIRGTVIPLTAKYQRKVGDNVIDETDHEYRINFMAEDRRNIDSIISSMEPLFASR